MFAFERKLFASFLSSKLRGIDYEEIALAILALAIIISAAAGTAYTQLSGTSPLIFKGLNAPSSKNAQIADAMKLVVLRQSGIYNAAVNVDDIHIGVTIQRSITGDDNAIAEAIRQIIANYAWLVTQMGYGVTCVSGWSIT